jgi:hypothetical protein
LQVFEPKTGNPASFPVSFFGKVSISAGLLALFGGRWSAERFTR